MSTNKEMMAKIESVRFNPSEIQRVVLGQIEASLDSTYDISDPTNPLIFLLEASSVSAAAAVSQATALTRKQYPSMAETEEELYLHMSDADFAGRFSSPSRTTFEVLLGLEEIYKRAVDTGVGSIRKLVIPRNSTFEVAGYKFAMQYPIEIRIMGHGGLHVVYDLSKKSPLQAQETNIVDWKIVSISGDKYLNLSIPVQQFAVRTFYGSLDSSTGFNRKFPLEDQYYYCRCYVANDAGEWVEVITTHTDQVYDTHQLTVALRVFEGHLDVQVPQIYFSNGLAVNELRVDIYTTKGPLDLILSSYETTSFTAQWIDLDGDDGAAFFSPLSLFNTLAVFSIKNVTGGSNGITFDELRERVMLNAYGDANLPITNAQLTAALEDKGYDVVKNVDNITNRIFIATRSLPKPSTGDLSTGAGCSIGMLQASVDTLIGLPTVKDNLTYKRITITPDTIYENIKGVVNVVSKHRLDAILASPVDSIANEVNSGNFIFTPFHYVLDMNNDSFSSRAYYLDSPEVIARLFVEENDTAGIEVATGPYKLERIAEGYKLTIITRSGPTFKSLANDKIFVQLSIRPEGEIDRAYINGVLVGTSGEERVYEFDILTRYDINAVHDLILTSFKMYDENIPRRCATKLISDFDITYVVADHTIEGQKESDIDTTLGKFMLPPVVVGVARERLRLKLGANLEGLWTNSRSVISSADYERYTVNVPWTYEANVYSRDPETGTIDMAYDPGTGAITYVILHHAGDPVLNEGGQPMYKYLIGDVKIDVGTGQPVVANPRGMLRQLDMFFVDGVYKFATEGSSVAYRETIAKTVVGWLVDDIAAISGNLLEQTKLYFYPKSTLGNIQVIIRDGVETSIDANQSFFVKFYMTKDGYGKDELRSALAKTASETISEVLKNATVAVSQIIHRLEVKVGSDVVAVEVTGLGGETAIPALTVTDDSARCNIRKRLQPLPDGTLAVLEDITVDFIRHQVD